MIKLSWEQLNESVLVSALISLNNNPKLEGKTAYRVGRICTQAQKEMTKAKEIEQKLQDEATKKDDAGKPLTDAKGDPAWLTDTAEKEFQEKLNKILAENFTELKVLPLDFSVISTQGGLTGRQLTALEPIMSGQPTEDQDA